MFADIELRAPLAQRTRRPRSRRTAAICALALLLGAVPALSTSDALAQSKDTKKAEELFQDGKKQFEASNFAEACSKLAQSDQLDPAIGTLGLLAACHEKQGKIASAWMEYRETQDRARKSGDAREGYAKERAEALEPQVPRVRIVALGNEPGLEVTLDGKRVEKLGDAMPLDPGDHELVATAPGKQEQRARFNVAAGARTDQTIAPLQAAGGAGPAAGGPVGPDPGNGAPATPPDAGSADSRRTFAYVAGGVGIAGLAVGSIFGLLTISKASAIDDTRAKCDQQPGKVCSDSQQTQGSSDTDSAFQLGMVSTVGFIVGSLGIAASAVLFLTAPSPDSKSSLTGPRVRVAPAIGVGSGGAIVVGSF